MYIDFEEFKRKYEKLADFEIIESANLNFLRKPAHIPSTFWLQKSVLNYLENYTLDISFCKKQLKNFSKEEEYWLLNRLDNATSGFLYFAKNKRFYKEFKKLQNENKIKKVYYTKVSWIFPTEKLTIDTPIMHKNKSKMIVIKSNKDIKKWRWKQHNVMTNISKITYDRTENNTYLKIIITKWIRHQIRVHLASIWYPIIWDELYWGQQANKLYLFSAGIINNL